MTESTQLAPVERAAVVLKSAERKDALRALVLESTDLLEVRNSVARDQVHGAYMKLKNTRLDIERVAEAAREDAKLFNAAMIKETKSLLAITDPEEARLKALRDEFDQRAERERAAKAEVERVRITALQADIQTMRGYPAGLAGATVEQIEPAIAALKVADMERFAELKADAIAARDTSIAACEKMLTEVKEREAQAKRNAEEAARLKVESDALAKRQAEQEEKERAARRQIEDEERAARARIQAQEDEARAARQAQEKRLKDEADRLEAAGRMQRMEQENRERAEREAKEASERQAREEADTIRRAAAEAEAKRIREEQAAAERAIAEQRSRVAKELEEKAKAQDRLAAAAPALLAALKVMLNKAYKQNWNDSYPDELAQAQAAVALAEEEEIAA